jgi:large subunit ribosomal protein L29
MKKLKDLKLLESSKIRDLSKEALKKEIIKSEKNLFVLRMKKETGELKQTHLIKFLRRYIAGLKTLAN